MRATMPIATVLVISIAGCADTTRDPHVDYSGFLGEYSNLMEGDATQAERRYLQPGVDWGSYDRVLLDPVTLWRGNKSRQDGVSSHEAQVMMNYFYQIIYKDLEEQGLDKLITGKPAFVGEAEIEFKVKDAVSGELLAAGVDHRVGGKFLQASHLTSWGEVQDMMKLWAEWGSYNLCKLQERATCLEPKI